MTLQLRCLQRGSVLFLTVTTGRLKMSFKDSTGRPRFSCSLLLFDAAILCRAISVVGTFVSTLVETCFQRSRPATCDRCCRRARRWGAHQAATGKPLGRIARQPVPTGPSGGSKSGNPCADQRLSSVGTERPSVLCRQMDQRLPARLRKFHAARICQRSKKWCQQILLPGCRVS